MGNITLGGGTLNYAGSTARSITNNITLTAGTSSTLNNANSTITVSGSIGGSGNLTKSGAGTLVLSGANSYTGTTTVSAGNLTITSGTALADNGAVTLANTTGAVLSVSTSETIGSLSGGGASGGNVVIASAQTLTVNQTTNTTFSGAISGANLVKTGSGTLTVNGSNTYTGTTTVDSGTLQAATANALANTSQVVLNSGGSFLVTADDAIGTNTDIELNGGTLAFGAAGYDGYVGALTLSANSTIDLGTSTNGVLLRFTNINWNNPNALLSIYNWTGNTQYSGNPGGGLDQVVIGNATTTPLSPSQLQQINFYSGIEQSSFIANAFQITSGNYNREIIAVPEPETYLTGVILLLGGTIYLFRRAKNREGHRPAWPKFLLGIRRTTPRYHLAQKPPDPHRADT
jgi:autotransporter-associated beta strand protein